MKIPLLALAIVCLLASAPARAADSPDVQSEMKALIEKVQKKLSAGEATEKSLAAEIKEFDAILARHSAEKSDAVAEVLIMKAMLYIEVFDEPSKGIALLEELKSKFPDTKQAKAVDQIVAGLRKQEAAKKIQAALAVGTPFPDFEEKDIDGKPLSISALKGKVVLVDFWATWCGPCVAELPNVLATYKKYHDKGLAIVGISLDQDKATLTSFIKERGMTWPQYFDGLVWSNKLAEKYGITSIPMTYLLGRDGKIIGENLRGDALGEAVGKALGGH
jgi:thiol-disulfide isomerase/thioredoxin